MSREIKRGGPFPGSRIEAKILGPYPTWDAWKHNITMHLGFNLRDLRNSDENHLREFYGLRRRIQNKDIPIEKSGSVVSQWQAETKEKDPEFFEKNGAILRFIVSQTTAPSENASRLRKAS